MSVSHCCIAAHILQAMSTLAERLNKAVEARKAAKNKKTHVKSTTNWGTKIDDSLVILVNFKEYSIPVIHVEPRIVVKDHPKDEED